MEGELQVRLQTDQFRHNEHEKCMFVTKAGNIIDCSIQTSSKKNFPIFYPFPSKKNNLQVFKNPVFYKRKVGLKYCPQISPLSGYQCILPFKTQKQGEKNARVNKFGKV